MKSSKEHTKDFTIAELDLTLSYDARDKDRINLTCHGYDSLDEHARKLLEEVVGCLDDAIELCTHKKVTTLESSYRTTRLFDISSMDFGVGADALFAIADHALGKISEDSTSTKHPAAMINKLREILRDADKHERNTLATGLRGGIQSVFTQFHTTQQNAAAEHAGSPVTRAGQTADNKLTDKLRDKLIHTILLDYYMGDRAIDEIVSQDSRAPGESVDTFVERFVATTDNAVKKKIDTFLQTENVAKRAPRIRHYLSGELASAIEKAIDALQAEQQSRQRATTRQ